jgi:protein-histidine pros-kinase
MRLLIKFNLVLILVFGTGIGIAGYISRNFLERSAQEEVLQQARLMMGAAGGMRTYTTQQLVPLLQAHQARIKTFLPQTVPAFSATEVFNYLRSSYPDYTYKEATLNPTNLRDRAVDWEADVIQNFRTHAETPSAAPPAMIRIYGTNNGFDWKLGDTVGAQIVSVPMSVPLTIADQAFRTLMIYLGGMALATLILLDLAMIMIVIRPVSRLAAAAEQISNGDFNVPEIPVKGSDEISHLAQSFNRMYVSMVKAIRLLESQ